MNITPYLHSKQRKPASLKNRKIDCAYCASAIQSRRRSLESYTGPEIRREDVMLVRGIGIYNVLLVSIKDDLVIVVKSKFMKASWLLGQIQLA